jgi:hypothetical protein
MSTARTASSLDFFLIKLFKLSSNFRIFTPFTIHSNVVGNASLVGTLVRHRYHIVGIDELISTFLDEISQRISSISMELRLI